MRFPFNKLNFKQFRVLNKLQWINYIDLSVKFALVVNISYKVQWLNK